MTDLSISRVQRPLIGILILVLLYFVYLAANWGLGDVAAYQTRSIMNKWSKKPNSLDLESWQKAQQYLSSALGYSANNSEYLALQGNLYEWRALIKNREPAEKINDYKTALDYYRRALHLRPAFAYYWANIAVVKSMLGEVDQEFYQAVDRSLALGAWEPGVQLKIADATLGVWYLLDENGWTMMLENVEKGLQSNPEAMMNLAKKYQVFRQLCARLRRTEAMLTYCQ